MIRAVRAKTVVSVDERNNGLKTSLHDKQSERDNRELRIDKVGVRNLRFPIQVRDKAHSVQNTVATIGLGRNTILAVEVAPVFLHGPGPM